MILDDLATLKAYAQTCQPDQLVQPVLLPSTKRTIASKAWAWFLVIASIFLLFPVALVTSLLFFLSFFNQSFSEEFFTMLKVSPLGATVISGYFVAFFVTWGTSFYFKVDNDTSLTCQMQSRSYFPMSSPYAALLDGFSSSFDIVEAIYCTCVLIACNASSRVTVSSQFSLLHHLVALSQCVCISILLSYIIIYIIRSCLRRYHN